MRSAFVSAAVGYDAGMGFRRTWKHAQQQATVALKAHRKAVDANHEREADRSMRLAQELVTEAVAMDKRAKPDPWDGDRNH